MFDGRPVSLEFRGDNVENLIEEKVAIRLFKATFEVGNH
jgi:hypothetical protein